MNKKNVLSAAILAVTFLAGMTAMRVWDVSRADSVPEQNASAPTDSLLIVDMEQASEPEGVTVAEEPAYADDSVIPSQLTKIKLPGIEQVISRSGASVVPGQEDAQAAPVELGNADYAAVPSATARRADPSESKISMIEAPVSAKLIKTAEEYKAFKRTARGSYPAADFTKDYILVLESSSNLPDKVFEIQDVVEQDGKMQVLYRVNIFGLDQKTNTHSAVRIERNDLPLELKQVL